MKLFTMNTLFDLSAVAEQATINSFQSDIEANNRVIAQTTNEVVRKMLLEDNKKIEQTIKSIQNGKSNIQL